MDGATLDPQLAWARSGAMALTGPADGTPRLAPGPLAAFASAEVDALAEASGGEALRGLDGAQLLGERAAVAGLVRRGRSSPGGSCRLLPGADGWLAVNLARPADVRALPAWLETDPQEIPEEDPWSAIGECCAGRPTRELVFRARLLGLPVAHAAGPPNDRSAGHRIVARGSRRERPGVMRVLDLASLWAGPLCAHLLGLAGADVIKVESPWRPDGARFGPRGFFDRINAGKRCVALDLRRAEGRAALRRLVATADVVVESARPRALQQLGIHAEELVAEVPGLVWVSITGYGRDSAGVAFGDDAACAAGLAAAVGTYDAPLFCGDAIADPLAGIQAARAAWQARARGGGVLIDVALRDAAVRAAAAAVPAARVVRRRDAWWVESAGGAARVEAPRARPLLAAARPLGADTGSLAC